MARRTRCTARGPAGFLTALLLGLIAGLLPSSPVLAGDRPDIYSFTPAQRADLYNHMSAYITATIVNEHLNPPGDKHGSPRFFVWHRNYIKGMEDYLISQNRPQFVPLPKWNPATCIPAEFTGVDPDCPPACNPLVNFCPGVGLPASLSTNLCSQVPFTANSGTYFRYTVEVGYHNGVHGAVGGVMGTYKSPGAPIFWLWHAFVDDLWFDWQCMCGLDEAGAFAPYTAAEKITDLEAGVADAWMRDSDDDIANEPNNETGAVLWESKDIWVRNSPATPIGSSRFLNEHQHQNPEYAAIPANRPYIYVKVRNRGCTTVSGQLHVYWANASTGLTWPTNFTEVSTSPVAISNLTAGREHVGEFHWLDIPVPGGSAGNHFCLIARFVASPTSADPITGEANNVIVSQNVRNSNQIAWKNLTVVDNIQNNFAVLIRNVSRNGNFVRLVFSVPPEERDDSYFDHGAAAIDLGPELFTRWIENGAMGNGVEVDPRGLVRILGPDATIDGLPMEFEEQFLVNMQFEPGGAPPCEDDRTVFHLRLSAFERETLLGGNTYEVPPDPVLPSPPLVVEAVDSPVNCAAGGAVLLRIVTQLPADTLRQWLRDGDPIPNAIGDEYVATQSGRYSVLATYGNGCDRESSSVRVHIGVPPPNDIPCEAILLGLDQAVPFDVHCATADPGEVTPGAGSGPLDGCYSTDGWCEQDIAVQNSLWYRFTAPSTGTVSIHAGHQDHDADHNLFVNTQLAVWRVGDCGAYDTYQLIAANDDSSNHGVWGTDPALHELTDLAPGVDYYIQLDGFEGAVGAGMLLVETAEAPCPADWNDDGVVNTADFFEFFAAFFGDPPDADFNGDGQTNTADFFEFFAAFFGPPCP